MTDEPRPGADDAPPAADTVTAVGTDVSEGPDERDEPGELGELAAAPARRRALPSPLTVGAALLVVALLSLVGVLGFSVQRTAAESDRREAALAGARQMAVNFTSLTSETIESDISDIVTLATGEFQQEYSTQAESIRQLVADQGLSSTGSVISAGLTSLDGDSAVALLAVDSVVTTAERPDGDTVRYRMQIDLVLVDGRWLSEKVQFVL